MLIKFSTKKPKEDPAFLNQSATDLDSITIHQELGLIFHGTNVSHLIMINDTATSRNGS